jgi:WD40 repeat protein
MRSGGCDRMASDRIQVSSIGKGYHLTPRSYDPDRGLPEPSEDQKRDREEKLESWWRKLRELQARITPTPKPKPEPEREPATPKSEPAECIDNTGWELRHTLTGHRDEVRSVSISPDRRTLASGSRDDTIKLWRLTAPT